MLAVENTMTSKYGVPVSLPLASYISESLYEAVFFWYAVPVACPSAPVTVNRFEKLKLPHWSLPSLPARPAFVSMPTATSSALFFVLAHVQVGRVALGSRHGVP